MKRKLKGVLGVALTLVMVLSLSIAMAPPVFAGDNEWSSPAQPNSAGSDGDWFRQGLATDGEAIEGLGPLARAIDGTLYCAVQLGTDTEAHLMKSTDDGRTWDKTDYQDDVAGEAIVAIACSSLDEDIVYVADDSTVYKTSDGGDKWVESAPVNLDGEEITSVDVGYAADDSPFVFIGTTDPGAGGDVYYLDEESYGAAWGPLDIGDFEVYGLGVSPDFAHDSLIAALAKNPDPADAGTFTVTSGTFTTTRVTDALGNISGDFIGTWDTDVIGSVSATGTGIFFIEQAVPPPFELDGAIDLTGTLSATRITFSGTVEMTGVEPYVVTDDDVTITDGTINVDDAAGTFAAELLTGLTGLFDTSKITASSSDMVLDVADGVVATNDGDAGVWDYLALDTAITDGSDPVFPADFDVDDAPELFVGVADSNDTGSVYRVDVGGGTTYRLGDEDADIIADVVSLDIIGDYGSTMLIAGTATDKVLVSTDDGDNWGDPDKFPSGAGPTYVVMDEDFDDNGIAWAAVEGAEGAVSLTIDSGAIYNQISLIRTDIDKVESVSFSRKYATDDTMFMVTSGSGTNSIWRHASDWERVGVSTLDELGTVNQVQLSPDFLSDETVYVALNGLDPAIYRSTDAGGDWSELTRQPDDLFGWVVIDEDTIIAGGTDGIYWTENHGRRVWEGETLTGAGDIISFSLSPNLAADETVLAGTSNGQIWISEDLGDSWDQVGDALDAGANTFVTFDPGYKDNDIIYATSGDEIDRCIIDTSDDWEDQTWKKFDVPETTTTATKGADSFSVTFGAAGSFTLDESNGAVLITELVGDPGISYTAPSNWTVTGAEATDEVLVTAIGSVTPCSGIIENVTATLTLDIVTDADDPDDIVIPETITAGNTGSFILPDVEAAEVTTTIAGIEEASGIRCMPDGTLYASDETAGVGVWRCLNPTESTIDDAFFEVVVEDLADTATLFSLQVTEGTNVLWALDSTDTDELWTYEDFLVAEVELDEPWSNTGLDDTDNVTLSWLELTGADMYELKYTDDPDFDVHIITVSDLDDTELFVEGLDSGETYYWKVRVQAGEPLRSEWSRVWNFTTKLGKPAAPEFAIPAPGAQDIILSPSFYWPSVSNANNYKVQIATDAQFTNIVAEAEISVNSWVCDTTLSYSTGYYWRVRALKDDLVISGWRVASFTTMAKVAAPTPPVTITPAPPAPDITVTVPAVPIPPTPMWVWAIIGIGGALVIAVIVLIVRTRRAM